MQTIIIMIYHSWKKKIALIAVLTNSTQTSNGISTNY